MLSVQTEEWGIRKVVFYIKLWIPFKHVFWFYYLSKLFFRADLEKLMMSIICQKKKNIIWTLIKLFSESLLLIASFIRSILVGTNWFQYKKCV